MRTTQGPKWTGKIMLPENMLDQPLRWKKPRKIFVNSMSDLFHVDVPDAYIDKVFAVMALCYWHTFQVLTKRPERMRDYLANAGRAKAIDMEMHQISNTRFVNYIGFGWLQLPLPNVWLGVSVENQATADERIPALLGTPAAIRWLSMEPLLGPVDLTRIHHTTGYGASPCEGCGNDVYINALDGETYCRAGCDGPIFPRINWAVVGGESGKGARPKHPAWDRSLRDQCVAAGIPFFLKQNGEWHSSADHDPSSHDDHVQTCAIHINGTIEYRPAEAFALSRTEGWAHMCRIGKKSAGRLLDGREWSEYPGGAL